jgi:ATP-dependent Lhr-like helicase
VDDALGGFSAPVRQWFSAALGEPTAAQRLGWPAISAGKSTLLLAPTGSGKTLAAFLAAIERLMFAPEPEPAERLRVLYVSPLKALAADVERNLERPLAGIAEQAERSRVANREVRVDMRSGDTPQSERARFARKPGDILITTPESLYLLLTSLARAALSSIETVIIDEIHSLVATKRGAHLFLSLERLEALRQSERPLQRIGLSATQRPLDEVARLLGGGTPGPDGAWSPRPVEIVDAGKKKPLEIRVEVPVEDMARLGEGAPDGPGPKRSIWPSIHPRLVELVRQHRSTMIFVNNRGLCERLSAAINDAAGEEISLAHHGSVARERRREIEERLKRGQLPAIVATSSLELGIDMGAVDLVVQVEAPPSVASGLQRIGRAGHNVGDTSRGVLFPKFRGDLLAGAAAVSLMLAGEVEETYYPENPLDVLAQQIVAMAAMDELATDTLFELVRRAAPFAKLPESAFRGLLDMLSGRYPSDEFAGLRARITWDRGSGKIKARQGARRLAVVSGGTIPDRGLYGVFLVGADDRSVRVGELDEEMVFESKEGDVFLLGASSWRIDQITHDRVLVTPAPGQPGRMPFWHGEGPGRPVAFGRAIGQLARSLLEQPEDEALSRLRREHGLDERAADNLVAYLRAQVEATGEVPSDHVIVVERFVDELGDFRVCVLSPFGSRVHAPWAMAVTARWRAERGTDIEAVWSDDGIAFRVPEADAAPDPALFVPPAEGLQDRVVGGLGQSSLFAARFRENAARALLLPRRYPGRRSPLWAQRKRSADLLAVASRYDGFPLLLETYRECLCDVFDVPALSELLEQIEARQIRVLGVETRAASPFASQLLFSYVANFIYDGDAPLAERRAHALGIDHTQLRELMGEVDLVELLEPGLGDELEHALQHLDRREVRHADALHDLLLALGDLSTEEIRLRADPADAVEGWLGALMGEGRVLELSIAGEQRFAAAEDAARYRDALGVAVPELPAALLEPVADPLGDLLSRYARTHGPFTLEAAARRLGLGPAPVREVLERLAGEERVIEARFSADSAASEWCDARVLAELKRRSLAALREQIQPVAPEVLVRFELEWQGLTEPRAGADALLACVADLAGAPLVASALESDVLPARVRGYRPGDLEVLTAAGEVTWRGVGSLGASDGRIALYPAEHYALLAPPPGRAEGGLASEIRDLLSSRGALFYADLLSLTGAFSGELLPALWELVWAGELTNDTLAPLRSLLAGTKSERSGARPRMLRSRRAGPAGSEGRWSLLPAASSASATERATALAGALLDRYGVVTREAVQAECIAGGFSSVYPVLRAMEQAGRVRRGYFVEGLGAAQFARPGATDRLRALGKPPERTQALLLAATDPASPYGAALPWPPSEPRPQRAAGTHVVLVDGALAAWLGAGGRNLVVFRPDLSRGIAGVLAAQVDSGRRRALLVEAIDGAAPSASPLAAELRKAGFSPGLCGYLKRAGVAALDHRA